MRKAYNKKIKYVLSFTIFLFIIAFAADNSKSILKIVYPLKYREIVNKYSFDNSLDPYLVFAVIKAESSFNPGATSRKNARGLMQITEGTAEWGAKALKMEHFTVENLYDPEMNIRIGCWYLKVLLMEFDNNIDLAVAAYNGGSGNVNEWLKNKNFSSSGSSLEKIPYKETERFLKKVKKYHNVYKRLYEL